MAFRSLRILTLCFVFFTLTSFSAFSATDPKTDWKVLVTPHFELIYDAKQKSIAERYARYAETAYNDLLPIFKEAPEKTVIWVNNTTDVSNGFATAFPYPMITVFPVIPSAKENIGEYGHWGQELMTHEYTHILQFEPQHGVMGALRWIFGSVIVPNGLLPRWWLEGLAVEAETQLGLGGRLRAQNQNAVLRNLSLSGQLEKEDIARANETSIPDWLGGSRPYLFGSLIWKELVDEKGNEAIYDLNQRYSRRVPFVINSPVEDLVQKDYAQVLQKAYQNVKKEAEEDLMAIRKAKVSPLEVEENNKEEFESTLFDAVLSPNQTMLAYIERHLHEGTRLIIKKRVEGKSFLEAKERVIESVSPSQRISWAPDSKSIYFDKVDSFKRFYNFSDIYKLDIENKKIERLSKGLRARDPAVSLDGKTVAFIKIEGDQLKLMQMDSNGENKKELYTPPIGHRIADPEFYSAQFLLFTERNKKNAQVLRVLQLKTGKVRTLLKDFSPVYKPKKSGGGLLFLSGKSGVVNAYFANKKLSQARPITNIETSVSSIDWDRQASELVLTYLGPQGDNVAYSSLPKGKLKAYNPPKIKFDRNYKRKIYSAKTPEFKVEEKDYSTWKYMLPHYWVPYVAYSTEGLFVQASTGSYDPLGKHAYSILGAYDTGTEEFNWVASYQNQMTLLPLSLYASDLYDFFGNSSTVRRQFSLAAATSGYVWGLSTNWTWSAGWDYLKTEVAATETLQQGPQVGMRYANLSRRGKQLVPENGGDALLTATYYIESLGDVGFFQTQLNTSYYFSKWLPKRHVLSTKVRGVFAPENDNLFIGASTAAGSFENNLISNQLLMRGYLSGNFIAQSAVNASLEYIFPLSYSYSGWGTAPLFSRHWHGRLVADVITQDGIFFDEQDNTFRRSEFGEFFYGAGGEIHWTVTAGYHVPFRIFLGAYYGFDSLASGGFQTFLGFGL